MPLYIYNTINKINEDVLLWMNRTVLIPALWWWGTQMVKPQRCVVTSHTGFCCSGPQWVCWGGQNIPNYSLLSSLLFANTSAAACRIKKKNTLKMGNCQVGTDPICRGRKAPQAAVWASIRVSAPRLWSRQLFGFKCNHYAGFPKNNVAFVAYSAWWIQPRAAAAAARCAQH